MPVPEAPLDPAPRARAPRAAPGQPPGHLLRGRHPLEGGPDPLGRLEGQDEREPRLLRRLLEPQVVAVGAVRHDRPERHARGQRRVDQLDRQLRLGAEGRVLLAPGQAGGRGVRADVQGVVDPLVGPERADRDDAVVGLADRAQVLAAGVGGVGALLAVAGVVDHQHTLLVRGGRRGAEHQLEAAGVERVGVPGRLGEEELEALDGRALGADDRLGAGQRRQRLVAVPREQQPLQVRPEAATLSQRAEQVIEPDRELLQRAGGGRTDAPPRHRNTSTTHRPHDPCPPSTN